MELTLHILIRVFDGVNLWPRSFSVDTWLLRRYEAGADAEDAAQAACLKAYRNLASFPADSQFGIWLVSITLNVARNHLRQNRLTHMESLE